MVPFSTEFPVSVPSNRAAFPAEIIAWLRGADYSRVLKDRADDDVDADHAHLKAGKGEDLRLRALVLDGRGESIGFRDDHPDRHGRLWRTKAALRNPCAGNGQGVFANTSGLTHLDGQD
ncbi:MAG: hypothetical protein H6899_01345 [Rhodobacter sp.]|nr:hypothetical protein [Paracoccaceae bacterium]MCB1408332.1 hypothetical protein [Paracoccaceae bacterium]MCC0078606.1 hypothetical protein [Rhodobacter sp.]